MSSRLTLSLKRLQGGLAHLSVMFPFAGPDRRCQYRKRGCVSWLYSGSRTTHFGGIELAIYRMLLCFRLRAVQNKAASANQRKEGRRKSKGTTKTE